MINLFKRKGKVSFPHFPQLTNEQVVFHIGAPKTGSSAIQKFCLENRKSLREIGFYYPEHGLDKNGISGGHSSFGKALMENELDNAKNYLNTCIEEAKKHNCVLLLSAESLFYSPDKLKEIVGDLSYKVISFYREPVEAMFSYYNQSIKRHFNTLTVSQFCKNQIRTEASALTSYDHARWLDLHGTRNILLLSYCDKTLKSIPIQRLFLRALGKLDDEINNNFDLDTVFLNKSYPLHALELKRLLNFVVRKENEELNQKIDVYFQSISDNLNDEQGLEQRLPELIDNNLKALVNSNYRKQIDVALNHVASSSSAKKTRQTTVTAMQLNVQMHDLLTQLRKDKPKVYSAIVQLVSDAVLKNNRAFELLKLAEMLNLEIDVPQEQWFLRGQIQRMPNYENVEFLRDIADLMYRRGDYEDARSIINAALELRPHGPTINEISKKIDNALNV